jgi:TBCC domain-containing protein 1
MAGVDQDDKEDVSTDEEESTAKSLAKLSLADSKQGAAVGERAKQPKDHYQKDLSYMHLRGTTILLKPNPPETSSGASAASGEPNFVGSLSSAGRLHDLTISDCSDAHFYLLQPFEHATISGCTGCTIVVGAAAGLLHVVDCEKTMITSAARRILVSNSCDVQLCVFTPSPPLVVGDNRSCQFGPYNTYYEGMREDLLATGLAAAVVPENQSPYHGGRNQENDAAWPPLQCASNKWKQPVELSKLEMPQVPSAAGSPVATGGAASPPGADDKAMATSGNDATMHAPVLVPASDFHILYVPVESDAARQRRNEANENEVPAQEGIGHMESQYCRLLAEVLQLSPFRLPVEYERRALMKAERMRSIQQAVQKNLTTEQQERFEEELNRGFRDWLVTSGNLRQVLDLVHLERRGGI